MNYRDSEWLKSVGWEYVRSANEHKILVGVG